MKKIYQIYFLAFAIVIIGCFGMILVVLQNDKSTRGSVVNTQVQVNTDISQPSASTWLTYADNRDRFSLSYPATWKVAHGKAQTGNDRGIWLYTEASPSKRYQLSIFVESNPKNLTVAQWVDSLQPTLDSRSKVIGKVHIGTYDGYAITNVFAGDSNVDQWYLAYRDNVYTFVFPVAETNENLVSPIENNVIARQILATFHLPSD